MQFKYLAGQSFGKDTLAFYHNLLGGDWVFCNYPAAQQLPEDLITGIVEQHDTPNTLWFFDDTFFGLHERLQGRQVLVEHGLSFKNHLGPRRIHILQNHIDKIFTSGPANEQFHLDAGTPQDKLIPVGLPLFLEIPDRGTHDNHVLFCSTWFTNWNHVKQLTRILQNLDPELEGHVTTHPCTPADLQNKFKRLCEQRENLHWIDTKEELLEGIARCKAYVGGLSSIASAFWYLKKPAILLRGRVGRNPLNHGLGWQRIKHWMKDPYFDQVLHESTKVSSWRNFSPELVQKAYWAPSTEDFFYPISYNKQQTIQLIQNTVLEIVAEAAKTKTSNPSV